MGVRDFLLLCGVCLAWGLNLVLTRYVVADAPPLFYAFVRFACVAIILLPFLQRIPRQWGWATLIGLCVGGLNFVLLFLGLKYATASSVAIAGQLGLPFTTLLSMIFLNETIGWRRALGMALAFVGVIVIAYQPGSLAFSVGIVFAILSALVASVGGVAMKKMEPIPVFQMQAWLALVSVPLPLALSLFMEEDQLAQSAALGWGYVGALIFSVIGTSIFGHGAFYFLIKRYEVTLITPLTLMTPVWAVVFGVVLLNETLSPKLALGAAIALSGVAIIALRQKSLARVPET
ncbi:MAG: EamA family transporter [Alphaproteobacteria bacterium]|nr:EamA family transporter [Alphaproteobacteria bacterium]